MRFGRKDYDKRIIDREGRIPADEPVFFLRGKDKLAPKLLLIWASEFLLNGGDPLVAESAIKHANKMIEYQRVHGCSIANGISDGNNSPYTNEVLTKIEDLIDKLDNLCDKNKIVTTKQDELDISYSKNLNELLRLVPDSEDNVMILTAASLKMDSYNKIIDELSIFDFDLSKELFDKAKSIRYLIYFDSFMGVLHFIKR